MLRKQTNKQKVTTPYVPHSLFCMSVGILIIIFIFPFRYIHILGVSITLLHHGFICSVSSLDPWRYKFTVLLTILSGQRVSTIHKFRLSQLQLTTDMAVFNLGNSLLKHSKPGRYNPLIHLYPHGVQGVGRWSDRSFI